MFARNTSKQARSEQLIGCSELSPNKNISAALLGAVFFASLALLALQITTARLLSATLSHHYAFAVLSLAMLGLGLGGILTHALQAWRRFAAYNGTALIVLYGVLTSLCVLFSTTFILWMAAQPYFYNNLWGYWLAVLLPFTLGGLLFAEIYKQYAQWAGQVYASDLLGASLGGAVAVVLLGMLGGIASQFAIAFLLAVSSLWFFRLTDKKNRYLLKPALAVLLFSVTACTYTVVNNGGSNWLKNTNPDKEIVDAISGPWGGEVTDNIWSAFGRTQLITYKANSDHRDIYIDGTAGTPMYQYSGDINNPGPAVKRLLSTFPGAVPFGFMPKDKRNSALIIGPGGGRDVLLAEAAGFKNITGVEVNPDLLTLMDRQSSYNGGLYTDFDHINVINAEGRHFIQRNNKPYDLIMMSLPVTNTSRSREGFSLTESYLLTQEAIGEYINNLTERGQLLVITHDELAVIRLVRVLLDALEERGINNAEAMQHIYVLGSFPYPIVVVSKQAFKPNIALGLLQQVQKHDFSIAASYIPHALRSGQGNPMFQAMAQGHLSVAGMEEFIAGHGHDVSGVTDNQPFFYNTDLKLPQPVQFLFKSALIVSFLFLFWPIVFGLHSHENQTITRKRLVRSPFIFAGLGAGFMLVEVSLVQRLTFFLGEPVLALAVLLGTILLFMGIGSLITTRFAKSDPLRSISKAAAAVAGLCVLYVLALPSVLQYFVGFELWARIFWSFCIIAPLALFLGMPFPLAIKAMRQNQTAWAVPWAWAVNGVFSVTGAAAAVVIAMQYGMAETFYAAIVLYLAVMLVAWVKRPLSESDI